MDEMPKIEVQEIGHLGLISAVVKKFKILGKINLLSPKKGNNQKINDAEAILAMCLKVARQKDLSEKIRKCMD